MATNGAQNIITAATGKVLQGAGIGTAPTWSTPTYPSASGTSRKLIVADGTNNVYTTETWAVPGTSGNILTSDGTNWTSAAPVAQFTQVNISSANWKTVFTTPVQVVATPGSGKVIIPSAWIFKLNYGGTNAFTNGQIPKLYYTTVGTTNGSISTATSLAFTGTTTTYTFYNLINNISARDISNNSISITVAVSDPTGNAAGDNTVSVGVWYTIQTIT